MSDEELERASASLEHREFWCGALVVLGLIIEVILALAHPSYDTWLERWGSVVGDALVAFGVLGEVAASARMKKYEGELTRRSKERLGVANVKAAEASERAATANDRAAAAEKEAAGASLRAAAAAERAANAERETVEAKQRLQRLSSPRVPDLKLLKDLLTKIPPARADIYYVRDCVDCSNLATWLAHCLREAGWEIVGGNTHRLLAPAGGDLGAAQAAGGQPGVSRF